MTVDVDVLIIGAGLSGVGAACHLEERLPGTSYLVLEARDAIGGTWDLFRYPGVRSDSDMFTLGYRFEPWTDEKAIADGPAILDYVRTTAREHGVEDKRPLRGAGRAGGVVHRRGDLDRARRRGTASRSPSAAASCGRAAATTATTRATPRTSRAPRTSPPPAAGWCTPSTGPRTSTTPAARSW